MKDLQDEIVAKDLIVEKVSLGKLETLPSSSSSLADEIEHANLQIENKKLENEVKDLKLKIYKMTASKSDIILHLKKLEELSNQRYRA